jgi:hypothetical protein
VNPAGEHATARTPLTWLRVLWVPATLLAGWTQAFPVAARILFAAIGIFFVGIGFFVYEDEEKKIQSLLEDSWVALYGLRLRVTAIERGKAAQISSLAGSIIDKFLGPKLISLRALVGSDSCSLFLACLFGLRMCVLHVPQREASYCFALLVAVTGTNLFIVTRHPRTAASILFLAILGTSYATIVWTTIMPLRKSWLLVGAIFASAVIDVAVVATVRRLIRSIIDSRTRLEQLSWLFILAGVSIASVVIPSVLRTTVESARNETLAFLVALDLSDLVAFSVVALLAMMLFFHHLIWNTLLRPLYMLQQIGVLARKEMARGLGIVFLSSAFSVGGKLMGPFWEFVKKKSGG